jgi:hypothetical protein
VTLGLIHGVTEMITRNLPGGGGGGKVWPALKAGNMTAISEAIV